ncbi:MAG: dienelactone hydrolase family protein [Nitrososphaeraceae archaeon]
MSKIGLSSSIFFVLSSMIIFPSYMNLVQGQLNSSDDPIRNVTALSNSTGNATEVVLQNSTVSYFEGAKGYLVFPVRQENNVSKLPAVIMIHEWWGLNNHIKDMANLLAKEGYVVLAADLYNGKVAADPNEAGNLVQSVRANQENAITNLKAGVKYVSSLPIVDKSKIASIGWCFGGGQSLQLALNSQDQPLAATILYYGTPLVIEKSELSKIKWPVLGIFGDKDQAIPLKQINQFKAALDEIGITNEIHIYPGIGHAFANPSGDNYAPKETQDAWEKTLSFLKRYVS